ncbi:MAG TPA: helix-turn-helix transcriptional regulator [Streptosporangiaceae bacterium]|jgi:transcriptional regulator with XRE-family HTH domain|nr:helix-turn-helix transcriptional regulator [Streptosporangiaceae bacterium]
MSPVNVSAIGAYIKEQREQAKISLRQLAQSAGISNPYLSQIERGLRRPSADILQQIAKGLRISAEALYVQAGFLEDKAPGSVVRDALLTDPELTERQKQMLIEVYESFRKETAMTRAEAAELDDDQSGLTPDEAALTWPENLSPASLAGLPRRLAIAAAYTEADDTGDQGDDDAYLGGSAEDYRPGRYLQDVSYERAGSDRDEPRPQKDPGDDKPRTRPRHEPESRRQEPGGDGTIRQFPPPAGNR